MSRRRHRTEEQDELPPGTQAGDVQDEASPDAVRDAESTAAASADAAEPDSAEPDETAADPVAEITDRWLRAKAELENMRRAARLETEQARRYGAGPAILGLLTVLDNLQRALASPPASLDEEYFAGLRLIERQFLDVLALHAVTPVPAERGTPLDPAVHRALMEQPSDEVAPGCILLVAVPGYRLHDRLLREAQVVVARAPGPAEA
jgi:molecular chaperone GrpE